MRTETFAEALRFESESTVYVRFEVADGAGTLPHVWRPTA